MYGIRGWSRNDDQTVGDDGSGAVKRRKCRAGNAAGYFCEIALVSASLTSRSTTAANATGAHGFRERLSHEREVRDGRGAQAHS
jgi:hypothetical protein